MTILASAAAVLSAVASCVAAFKAHLVRVEVRTGNGHTLGEAVSNVETMAIAAEPHHHRGEP